MEQSGRQESRTGNAANREQRMGETRDEPRAQAERAQVASVASQQTEPVPGAPGGKERRRKPRLPRDPAADAAARAREFARRFRKPIVGLALATTAAPLVRSTTRPAPPPGRAPVAPDITTAGAAMAPDIEERVGEVWAEAERDQRRASIIQSAVQRYGISPELAQAIYDEAVAADIDPQLAFGLVKTESSFRQRAVSSVGARGLTQVMPRTARWLQPGITAEDLFEPRTNLRLGFRYLRGLINKYGGNVRLALLAYNRGPGTVDRVLAQGGDPDNGYADMVLSG